MTLRFTLKAEEDLIGIYAFGVERFGVAQAERYYAELQAVLMLLAETPLMAREFTSFQPPVRVHFHGSHVIIYVADDGGALIIRILGNRQNWARVLTQEGE